MLAKLTSKNQLTLPADLVRRLPASEYFDATLESGAIVLRPVQDIGAAGCTDPAASGAGASCSVYLSTVYADYTSSPNAKVEISTTITGRNDWKIFSPAYNQYTNSVYAIMLGENHGWVTAKGELASGIGSYDAPKI